MSTPSWDYSINDLVIYFLENYERYFALLVSIDGAICFLIGFISFFILTISKLKLPRVVITFVIANTANTANTNYTTITTASTTSTAIPTTMTASSSFFSVFRYLLILHHLIEPNNYRYHYSLNHDLTTTIQQQDGIFTSNYFYHNQPPYYSLASFSHCWISSNYTNYS